MRFLSNYFLMFLAVMFIVACKPSGEKAETGAAEEVEAVSGTEFSVDAASSKLLWEGAKVSGKHNGTVNVSEGALVFDGDDLKGGSFTIDMNSVSVLDLEGNMKDNLENHLKGTAEGKETDFFNGMVARNQCGLTTQLMGITQS